jgi:hypothetical protein
MLDYIASIYQTGPPYDFPPYGSAPPFLADFMTIIVIIGTTSVVLNLVLIYMLVNRRRTHFKRQRFLYEDLVAATKSLAATKNIEAESGLSSIERTVREADAEETTKDAVLWAVLAVFVPFAALYVYYFLMKDFYRHEQRENGFWRDLGTALDKLGVNFSVPRRNEAMPDRSFALYLILTLITLGLFGVYWLYVLLKDPNEHFNYHIEIERQLLSALETVAN